jgi:hypothetical protein
MTPTTTTQPKSTTKSTNPTTGHHKLTKRKIREAQATVVSHLWRERQIGEREKRAESREREKRERAEARVFWRKMVYGFFFCKPFSKSLHYIFRSN